MPIVILAVVLVALGVGSVWSTRRVRRRLLGGSAAEAKPVIAPQTPTAAANELRATIDAMNGRGTL